MTEGFPQSGEVRRTQNVTGPTQSLRRKLDQKRAEQQSDRRVIRRPLMS